MAKHKLLIILSLSASCFMPLGTHAAQDCDNNAIIWCGANSQTDFTQAVTQGDGHNSAADITAIYAASGVNPNLIGSTIDGTVTKDGNVKLSNNRTVATNAQSIGRQFISGSTQRGNVWIRPTSVSFVSDSLPAFVYMQNDQFMWAVIKACGNPVIAKPVITVTAGAMSTPTPVPVPIPKPVPVPTPVPVPVPVPTPQPVSIPKTGPEVTFLGSLATPAIWLGFQSYRKSRKKLEAALKAM